MQTLTSTLFFRGLVVAGVIAALLTGATLRAEANAVCQGIPTAIEDDTASESSGAIDATALHDARAPMEAEMDALCRTSADAARLFKARAQRVVFVMAAGATEPTPYLSGSELIVEFHGGPFDAGAFGGAVDDALHGVVPEFND